MKPADLESKDWEQWAPYVDTVCIPVYQIRISDRKPDLREMKWMEQVSHRLEGELRGRLLLLPPIAYGSSNPKLLAPYLEGVAEELREARFHHLILLFPRHDRIMEDWNLKDSQGFTPMALEKEVDDLDKVVKTLVRQIVDLWDN
ncbi:DUF2487 family protein [Kroppenstedtia pulmonis]|uniref:DUF2487 family protein n=1 Tax=Kroppenstedtia pulmonis TaxID=1380685 RepID=A0A7D3Y4I9_9BACL|nr:DUF2487 family protein [Kroppenstedtia pulmonis]QKG84345.1 DUF2487 family protein [Kroppenstedtia pulmonis]